MSQDREFAYGTAVMHRNGEELCCPSVVAGFDPNLIYGEHPGYARIADQYDTLVIVEMAERDGIDVDDIEHSRDTPPKYHQGIVDEETARKCWLRAVEIQDDAQAVEAGEKVTAELGWEDD